MLSLPLFLARGFLRRWRHRAALRGGSRAVRPIPSDATVLYRQMLELLDRRGFEKPPWLTPVAHSPGVLRAPVIADLVAEATAAYNELRFGGRRDAATRMMHALEQIRQL